MLAHFPLKLWFVWHHFGHQYSINFIWALDESLLIFFRKYHNRLMRLMRLWKDRATWKILKQYRLEISLCVCIMIDYEYFLWFTTSKVLKHEFLYIFSILHWKIISFSFLYDTSNNEGHQAKKKWSYGNIKGIKEKWSHAIFFPFTSYFHPIISEIIFYYAKVPLFSLKRNKIV